VQGARGVADEHLVAGKRGGTEPRAVERRRPEHATVARGERVERRVETARHENDVSDHERGGFRAPPDVPCDPRRLGRQRAATADCEGIDGVEMPHDPVVAVVAGVRDEEHVQLR
jgi:hypothetical protein